MRVWLVLALAGCNQIYGLDGTHIEPDADLRPDRDHDGIADIVDPCISPAEELTSDSDGDGLTDRFDPCLIGKESTDSDGDGVFDECDPFPNSAGDRLRCNMAFGSRETTTALWQPRPGELAPLAGSSSIYIVASGSGVTPEDVRVLGDAPTVVVDTAWFVAYASFSFRIGLWVNAKAVPGADDVACVVFGQQRNPVIEPHKGKVVLQIVGPGVSTTPDSGPLPQTSDVLDATTIALRVLVQPGRSDLNLQCEAGYVTETGTFKRLVQRARLAAPLERFGFFANDGLYGLAALSVFERDDTPPLP